MCPRVEKSTKNYVLTLILNKYFDFCGYLVDTALLKPHMVSISIFGIRHFKNGRHFDPPSNPRRLYVQKCLDYGTLSLCKISRLYRKVHDFALFCRAIISVILSLQCILNES